MGRLIVASYCSTFLKPEMLHVYRQVTSLRGVQTFVLTKAIENPKRFPFHDIEQIPRPPRNLLRHGWLKFVERRPPLIYRGEYQQIVSILERRGADMMHIYFGHAGVHLLPLIREWGKPCVVSFHGADVAHNTQVQNYRGNLQVLFDSVPIVLARSQSLANQLIKFGCPREKIRLNRTGVPLRDFPFVERQFPRDGRFRVLQACRLIEKKGVASSIRSFALFAKSFPESEFLIAGKGPLQPDLEALTAELGLTGKVHFCGFVKQRHLRELYSQAHVFIHPSETPPDENQEGVPNSILEAMATGLPIIATRHGGIPEAVTHQVNGFLAPERDYQSLAAGMIELASAPEKWRRFTQAARDSVAASYDQDLTSRALENVYAEACERVAAPVFGKNERVLSAPLIERAVAK